MPKEGTHEATLEHVGRHGTIVDGGEGGIRTHERIAPLRDFQSRLFGHSSTSPVAGILCRAKPLAERVGFEPTSRCNREPLFESGAISLSATSPQMYSIPHCRETTTRSRVQFDSPKGAVLVF